MIDSTNVQRLLIAPMTNKFIDDDAINFRSDTIFDTNQFIF